MATISVYMTTLNPLFWQSTIEATIRQSLLFADEIIVADGGSTDGTIKLIEGMQREDARIWLYHYHDDYGKGQEELANRRNFALSKCSSDYVVLHDDDEMIHERYATQIQDLVNKTPEAIAFKFQVTHFYRSWSRYQSGEGWYPKKVYMVKNIPQIRHGAVGSGANIDPDNFVFNHEPLEGQDGVIDTNVMVYHYGHCRSDPVMLLKKYYQEVSWWGTGYWYKKEFPFRFADPDMLLKFERTHPKYMLPVIKGAGNSRWLKDFNLDYRGFPWNIGKGVGK